MVSQKKGGRVLTAGKNIKGQQFTVSVLLASLLDLQNLLAPRMISLFPLSKPMHKKQSVLSFIF